MAGLLEANRLVVILKARQLGLTWLVVAFALWLLLFHHRRAAVSRGGGRPGRARFTVCTTACPPGCRRKGSRPTTLTSGRCPSGAGFPDHGGRWLRRRWPWWTRPICVPTSMIGSYASSRPSTAAGMVLPSVVGQGQAAKRFKRIPSRPPGAERLDARLPAVARPA